MIIKICATIGLALLAFGPRMDKAQTLSAANIKKLSKPVQKAMGYLTANKQSDFYDAVDVLMKTIRKIEKKSKFPVLADTGAWSAMLSQAQAPAKLSKGVVKSGRFGKARNLAGLAGKKYLVSIPKSYKVGKPVSVIVALHPKLDGSGRADTAVQKWAEATVPDDVRKESVILAPINEDGIEWATMAGCTLVLSAIKDGVFLNVHYDPARIYFLGDGAALSVASLFPSLVGGVILTDAPPKRIPYVNVRPIPILAVGEAAAAIESASGEVKLDIEKAGDTSAIADWMSRKKKDFYPETVEIVANNATYASAFWVQAVRLQTSGEETDYDQYAHIEAHVDREANEFVVTSNDKVLEFWLFLNDDLVDMDRPIKIVLNGKVRFEGTKARSLTRLFKYTLTPTHGNLGAAFVDRIEIAID